MAERWLDVGIQCFLISKNVLCLRGCKYFRSGNRRNFWKGKWTNVHPLRPSVFSIHEGGAIFSIFSYTPKLTAVEEVLLFLGGRTPPFLNEKEAFLSGGLFSTYFIISSHLLYLRECRCFLGATDEIYDGETKGLHPLPLPINFLPHSGDGVIFSIFPYVQKFTLFEKVNKFLGDYPRYFWVRGCTGVHLLYPLSPSSRAIILSIFSYIQNVNIFKEV